MNNNLRTPNEPNYLIEKDLMRSKPVLKGLAVAFIIVSIIIILFEQGITENVIKLIIFMIIFWIFVAIMLWFKKLMYTNKNITNNGIKVEGTIKSFKMRYTSASEDTPRNIEVFYLIISYIDPKTNKEKEFKTPLVNFNPVNDLGSKKCSVWINKNKIYATDFVIGKNIGKNIWDRNDPSIIKYQKQRINHDFANIIGTILGILFILYFLSLIIN
jgi:hypothetical protein